MEARPASIDVRSADHGQFILAECRQNPPYFFRLIDGEQRATAPRVNEFFGGLHVVSFFISRTYRIDLPAKKGTVAIQSAFIGKNAYSGEKHEC